MENKFKIPAKYGKAFKVKAKTCLKLVNTHGTQVVDCWAFNSSNISEFMCMETSRVWNQRLNPIIGDTFVTNQRNPILTIIEDTSPGIHDTFMAACDSKRYQLLGVKEYHRNCADNLIEAMLDFGIALDNPILASFNIFMNIEVQDDKKTLKTKPTKCKPGDYINLRAEMDSFVVFSACPQDIVRIQGSNDNIPKSINVLIDENSDNFNGMKIKNSWIPD